MPITGPLAHIDLSVGHPERSIPFYAAFFEALGYDDGYYAAFFADPDGFKLEVAYIPSANR